MSDDFDVLTRLTDYHDHIAAPTVHVADDVRRGRRRVARRRTLAAGGVALAVAGIVLTASLVTRSDPAKPRSGTGTLALPDRDPDRDRSRRVHRAV